jgi:hypothetical protein
VDVFAKKELGNNNWRELGKNDEIARGKEEKVAWYLKEYNDY